jgi:Xaa-Pro aminopeptidase
VDRVEVWRWYDAGELPGRDPYVQGVIEINTHLAAHAGQRSGRRVGIELGWLPHGVALADAHPANLTPAILDQRRRKHPDELALIREALATCEAGHRAVRDLLLGATAADLTELEVYNTAHAAMVGHLGGPVHLLGDFAGGKRAETTGGPPTSNRLAPGDLMIVDMFPIVNGYRADFTATYAVGGMMRGVAAALDAALHEALAAGEALLRPGMKAGDIYRAVRGTLDTHGFGAGFPHHAGHGLGLGHPEAPYFVPASEETLIEGDVVTLEPGSYGDGYGARIEHNYLITATGAERLTHHNTQMR